jgi:hypothetical protein
MPAARSSSTINSSPRPKANPRNTPATKSTVTSSPRPVTRTSAPSATAPKPGAQYTADREDTSDDNKSKPTTAKPKALPPTTANPGPSQQVGPGDPILPSPPPTTAPSSNPNLPRDTVEASRGERRPDRSLVDALQEPGAKRSAQKYRGTVLSAVYKMPADPAKSAKTLQQFNGPRGQRMTLGA